ncbi:unnamed protein product [Phytophthora fragariaefolia]|uniref:Unnamed protein product n=1 Tax=Phytophthora fragariaefolia TaxID=1490495 RepID=A0A9W6XSH4_9STRA|nr:unnamed protein product [Phytophthora fragariaefolia]
MSRFTTSISLPLRPGSSTAKTAWTSNPAWDGQHCIDLTGANGGVKAASGCFSPNHQHGKRLVVLDVKLSWGGKFARLRAHDAPSRGRLYRGPDPVQAPAPLLAQRAAVHDTT